ncbi:MAG: uridine kinase family protein [Fimbriimonas sp.]
MDLDALAQKIRSLRPSAGRTAIVGIDGCGGAGKSTLAAALAARLPGSVVVHTDDFASWEEPTEWWPRLLEGVLVPLSQGQPGRYQRYDWVERRLAEWHHVEAGVVLLEGVTAIRREFRPYLAYRIWVDCPRELRLQRGLERDGAEAAPLWQEWMAAEDRYCEAQRPRDAADLIVKGDPTSL